MFRRRQGPAADQYEAAAQRLGRQRRLDDEGVIAPPVAAMGPGGRGQLKFLLVFFVGAVLFALVQASRSGAPELAADCDRAQLALSTAQPQQGDPVHWTATGPADAPAILAIGVASFDRGADGEYRIRPLPGRAAEQTQAASHQFRLSGCVESGYFGVTVPPGEHTVTLFRLTESGSESLASHRITVQP